MPRRRRGYPLGRDRRPHLEPPLPGRRAQGLEFARLRIAPTDRVLVHAAPSVLHVEVLENGGALVALGEGLGATAEAPMTRLRMDGLRILFEDAWPGPHDIGAVVLLCGGEAGVLRQWWHAEDRSEWRWQLELSNGA